MAKTVEIKRVCRCEKCGNEAEMTVVCDYVPVQKESAPAPAGKGKAKGTFTCMDCGNEAELFVDD